MHLASGSGGPQTGRANWLKVASLCSHATDSLSSQRRECKQTGSTFTNFSNMQINMRITHNTKSKLAWFDFFHRVTRLMGGKQSCPFLLVTQSCSVRIQLLLGAEVFNFSPFETEICRLSKKLSWRVFLCLSKYGLCLVLICFSSPVLGRKWIIDKLPSEADTVATSR